MSSRGPVVSHAHRAKISRDVLYLNEWHPFAEMELSNLGIVYIYKVGNEKSHSHL